jgi:hypothetical protein
MTPKEAGKIKAALTRAGWHHTGTRHDRQWDDPDSIVVAVTAAPEPYYNGPESEFSNLEEVRLVTKSEFTKQEAVK